MIRAMKEKVQTARKGPINPFMDWGFKYMFGREETKETLIGFLNLLLNPDVYIINISYLNTELLGDSPELKRCVVDVLATDEEGIAISLRCRTPRTMTSENALCIMLAG